MNVINVLIEPTLITNESNESLKLRCIGASTASPCDRKYFFCFRFSPMCSVISRIVFL